MFEDPYERAKKYLEWIQGKPKFAKAFRKTAQITLKKLSIVDQALAAGNIIGKEYVRITEGKYQNNRDYAFVTPSSRYPGSWRWTWFDERGWCGHFDHFVSPKDAFYDMVEGGYRTPAFGALGVAMAGRFWSSYLKNPARVLVPRHRTAISRRNLSVPLQLAGEAGLLRTTWSILDYGSGRGDDVKLLNTMGIRATGWDPEYSKKTKKKAADVVNLGFVINVIENRKERDKTLRSAWRLAKRVLIVSARLASKGGAGGKKFKDGILTSTGTFQKYYTQKSLKNYIEKTLKAQAQEAGPGVFFVFKKMKLMRNPGITSKNKKSIKDILKNLDLAIGKRRK